MHSDTDTDTDPSAQPDSKRRILSAAHEVLAEVGYEGASITEISRRSALPVGSIYHHFGSKAGVYAALAADFARAFWGRFEHTATDPDAGIERRLQEFVDDTRENVIANHYMFVLHADLGHLRVDDPQLDARLSANTGMAIESTTALIARVLRPESPGSAIEPDDVPAIARALLRFSRGATLEHRNDPGALAASFEDYHFVLRRMLGLD